MKDHPGQVVLVTGAAGFIGKVVVQNLLAAGWSVRAMVRREPPVGFCRHPRLTIVRADMRDQDALAHAVQGCAAVVHLAAAKADEPDSDEVNVGGAQRLAAACLSGGCRRLINISTQSAKIRRQGTYARTKLAADQLLHATALEVTTLRPSIVYGEEQSGVFGTLLKFIRKLPIVPVLGDGRWISAPVHVEDLAAAVLACLREPRTIGQIYDVGGPDQISFDDLIERIGTAVGRRRPKLHVPFGLSLLLARLATRLLPKPPITVSNVLGSNQNTDIDIGPARRDFGFAPRPLAAGLAGVLPAPPQGVLADEARWLSHYLLGVEPAPALVARYMAGCQQIWAVTPAAPEVAWWRAHPRWLPLLDAAAGLRHPQSLLRQKVLLMAALLETVPEYAGFYLRPPPRRPWILVVLAWQGSWAVAKALMGLPVLAWARRGVQQGA